MKFDRLGKKWFLSMDALIFCMPAMSGIWLWLELKVICWWSV